MLSFVYHALSSFRPLFSRKKPYLLFILVVLGFMTSTQMEGVTSFCRHFRLNTPTYLALLHFFRSTAYDLSQITFHWQAFAITNAPTLRHDGRLVILGDHTNVTKEGRRMPGVHTIHQASETQSKPTFFRGHEWGVLGLLIGSLAQPFCLPLSFRIHGGFRHITEEAFEAVKDQKALRLLMMAAELALFHGQSILLVLDAYFATGPVFRAAAVIKLTASNLPFLSVLTRAKKSYVGVAPKADVNNPVTFVEGTRLKLYEVFSEYGYLFHEEKAVVYGREELVKLLTLDLFWPSAGQILRFVFAKTSRGIIVLMTNDITMSAKAAVEWYCLRYRIETMFLMLKSVIGAFCYHFWTRSLARHSRKPKKNDTLIGPEPDELEKCAETWGCYERFVTLGGIALGLLQLVSWRFGKEIWKGFHGFLRSRSRSVASERTSQFVFRQLLSGELEKVRQGASFEEDGSEYPRDLEGWLEQMESSNDTKT